MKLLSAMFDLVFSLLTGSRGHRIHQPQVLLKGDDSRVLRSEGSVPVADESVRRGEQGVLCSLSATRHSGQGMGSVGGVQ